MAGGSKATRREHSIIFESGLKKRTREGTKQPTEYIASDLHKDSIRNEHQRGGYKAAKRGNCMLFE